MPTYEYECSKCGETFEAFQSITARPLTKCRNCGAKGTVSRLVSPGAGVIFKGPGFYVTDYKKSGSAEKKTDLPEKPPEKTEKKDKSESASKSSSPPNKP